MSFPAATAAAAAAGAGASAAAAAASPASPNSSVASYTPTDVKTPYSTPPNASYSPPTEPLNFVSPSVYLNEYDPEIHDFVRPKDCADIPESPHLSPRGQPAAASAAASAAETAATASAMSDETHPVNFDSDFEYDWAHYAPKGHIQNAVPPVHKNEKEILQICLHRVQVEAIVFNKLIKAFAADALKQYAREVLAPMYENRRHAQARSMSCKNHMPCPEELRVFFCIEFHKFLSRMTKEKDSYLYSFDVEKLKTWSNLKFISTSVGAPQYIDAELESMIKVLSFQWKSNSPLFCGGHTIFPSVCNMYTIVFGDVVGKVTRTLLNVPVC
jgi:hypothetical protein